MFTLVVDDFGIRYTNKQDVDDLIAIINKEYKCSQEWTGNRYIGRTLNWNYEKDYVDLSIPDYIARALQHFVHPMPKRPEHAPHDYAAPTYGSRQQFATIDTSLAVNSKGTKRIQEVLGTLLYYARAVDCIMIPAIGTIATQQANATTATMKAITKLLSHCATHPSCSCALLFQRHDSMDRKRCLVSQQDQSAIPCHRLSLLEQQAPKFQPDSCSH
jgi:hypothetical protein